MMRTTIYLDHDLNDRVRRRISGRGLNRFITQAVIEKLEALERSELELAMREGYIAAASADESGDWEVVDLENWPN